DRAIVAREQVGGDAHAPLDVAPTKHLRREPFYRTILDPDGERAQPCNFVDLARQIDTERDRWFGVSHARAQGVAHHVDQDVLEIGAEDPDLGGLSGHFDGEKIDAGELALPAYLLVDLPQEALVDLGDA